MGPEVMACGARLGGLQIDNVSKPDRSSCAHTVEGGRLKLRIVAVFFEPSAIPTCQMTPRLGAGAARTVSLAFSRQVAPRAGACADGWPGRDKES